MALQQIVGPWSLFRFLILHTVCRTTWTGDKTVARPLPKHRTTQTQNKRRETFMPWVGFEPTIPAFERAKTVHALDCAATVIRVPYLIPSLNYGAEEGRETERGMKANDWNIQNRLAKHCSEYISAKYSLRKIISNFVRLWICLTYCSSRSWPQRIGNIGTMHFRPCSFVFEVASIFLQFSCSSATY
jgi:hypothetical protein